MRKYLSLGEWVVGATAALAMFLACCCCRSAGREEGYWAGATAMREQNVAALQNVIDQAKHDCLGYERIYPDCSATAMEHDIDRVQADIETVAAQEIQ